MNVLVYAADFSQRDHLHLRQPGGGVPQTSDGPGSQADLPGHLQLHQVPHQAGVREIPAGMMAHAATRRESCVASCHQRRREYCPRSATCSNSQRLSCTVFLQFSLLSISPDHGEIPHSCYQRTGVTYVTESLSQLHTEAFSLSCFLCCSDRPTGFPDPLELSQ